MFPSDTLEKAIRDEIAISIANRPTQREPWEAEVDSLVMVSVVLRVEEEINVELPDDIMPAGGFNSLDHCVDVVMKKCAAAWTIPVSSKQEA